jgi:hypothetical protein
VHRVMHWNWGVMDLSQGCDNGLRGGFARNPGGGPESRLWAAVVERAHGRANSSTRRITDKEPVVHRVVHRDGGWNLCGAPVSPLRISHSNFNGVTLVKCLLFLQRLRLEPGAG